MWSTQRWLVGPVVVAVIVCAGLLFVIPRSDQRSRLAAARELWPAIDTRLQECVFGRKVRSAELGRYEIMAEVTGEVDLARVASCAELSRTEHFELIVNAGEQADLAFWFPRLIDHAPGSGGFGLCAHLAQLREAARGLGLDAPAPDCDPHLEALPGIIAQDEATSVHAYRDRVALVRRDEDGASRVSRTRDGKTWEVSSPENLRHTYVTTDMDVFGLVLEHGAVHYAILDGGNWHHGARVDGAGIRAYRRTTDGWTIVAADPETDAPLVLHLDPMMDHVMSRTIIPERRLPRSSYKTSGGALFGPQGDVGALAVTLDGDHVSIEEHGVTPDGQLVRTRTTQLPSTASVTRTHLCHGATTHYLILEDVGTFVTSNASLAFTELRNGKVRGPMEVDCTDAHLFIASEGDFASCDDRRCEHIALPLPRSVDARIGLNVRGEQPEILATYQDVALHATLGEYEHSFHITSIWRVERREAPWIVRIADLWFAPSSIKRSSENSSY